MMTLDELDLLINHESENYYIYQDKFYSLTSYHSYPEGKHTELLFFSKIMLNQFVMINIYYSFKIEENKATFLKMEYALEKFINNYLGFFKNLEYSRSDLRASYLRQLNKQNITLHNEVNLDIILDLQQQSLEQQLKTYSLQNDFISFKDYFKQTIYPEIKKSHSEELTALLDVKQKFLEKLLFKDMLDNHLDIHIEESLKKKI